ncbi:MAG: DUF6089 family protein [Cyclobacteriaceae bacterium]
MKRLFYIILSLTLVCFVLPSYGQQKRNKKALAKSYKNKHSRNKRIKKHRKKKIKLQHSQKALGTPISRNYKLSKNEHYLSVGLQVGAFNYKGEYDQTQKVLSGNLKSTRPAIGVTAVERMSPNLSLRASLMYGRLSGGDADLKEKDYLDDSQIGKDLAFHRLRNTGFTNDILEFKVDAIFEIISSRGGGHVKRAFFTPYVFAGVGVFTNNPKFEGKSLRDIGTSGQNLSEADKALVLNEAVNEDAVIPDLYSTIQLAIPFGVGVRQKINDHFDLSFEVGVRFTFTDYIDDIGNNTVFVGEDLVPEQDNYGLLDPSIVQQITEAHGLIPADNDGVTSPSSFNGRGQPRGGSKGNFFTNRDFYIFTGFQLTYVLSSPVVTSKF